MDKISVGEDDNIRRIKTYSEWDLLLHPNQSYLGRTLAIALRPEPLDATQMSLGQRDELFELVIPQLHFALLELYSPDRLNIASFCNEFRHLHWHFIPRYDSPRDRYGLVFVDPKPSQNYSPTPNPPEGFNEKILSMIRDEIKLKINP